MRTFRFMLCWFVVGAALQGCNLFTSIDSPSEEERDVGDAVGDVGPTPDVGPTSDAGRDVGDEDEDQGPDCTPAPDAELCAANSADCGTLEVVDDCGVERTVECGTCDDDSCGAATPNVCGCPCEIDGRCYPAGPNPDNSCLVCDPETDPEGWVVTVDAPCDDGDACSAQDRCFEDGRCGGFPVDCSAFDTECNAAACDPEIGCHAIPDDEGDRCTSDGDACTDDRCVDGVCTHTLAAGRCQIEGECFEEDERNPENWCEICDPDRDPNGWSPREEGQNCIDGDGRSCTSGECQAGVCVSVVDPNRCLIDDDCYAAGDTGPAGDCAICDPDVSTTDWSLAPNGVSCTTGGMCEAGICMNGACVPDLTSQSCAIASACWSEGTLNPSNDCEVCDPDESSDDWSELGNGTSCTDDDGLACTSGQCSNGNCETILAAGFCVIDDRCVTADAENPTNPCEICDPSQSTTDWSFRGEGDACDDGDGLACTDGACYGGTCVPEPAQDTCQIAGVCYSDGDERPDEECQVCDPSQSQDSWTARPDGASCGAGDTCSGGVCAGDGCSPTIDPDRCLIDGVCYREDDVATFSPCHICDPRESQTSWTTRNTCGVNAPCADTGYCFSTYCTADVDEGWCLIGGVCYQDGDTNPDLYCQSCDADGFQFIWTTSPGYCRIDGECYLNGDVNPEEPCQVCDVTSARFSWSTRSGWCEIGGRCYRDGEEQPGQPCRECDSSKSQTSFSNASNNKICDGTCTCLNGVCDADPLCL